LNKKNIILAIETSCDETSVAIVKNGQEVLACETATSIPLHQITKGVVPEVAARAQIEAMIPTLDLALKKAQLSWSNIDLIAVTEGPGLIGLNYPAGVEVSKLADAGNKETYKFPRSMINSQNYNFSFSGLKTAFLYKLKNIEKSETKINKKIKADLCASLQEAICEILWLKVKKALNNYVVNEVHLSGEVSANTRLRETIRISIVPFGCLAQSSRRE